MKIIVIESHKEECWAMEAVRDGEWPHPWGTCESSYIAYDKLGRKHPRASMAALVFNCNNPFCPGRVAVRMEDVVKALGLAEEMKDELD